MLARRKKTLDIFNNAICVLRRSKVVPPCSRCLECDPCLPARFVILPVAWSCTPCKILHLGRVMASRLLLRIAGSYNSAQNSLREIISSDCRRFGYLPTPSLYDMCFECALKVWGMHSLSGGLWKGRKANALLL